MGGTLSSPSPPPLAAAMEGWLQKRGLLLGSVTMKSRYFVLQPHSKLLLIKDDPHGKVLNLLDLSSSAAVQLSDSEPQCIEIVTPERLYQLVAPSAPAAREWVSALEGVVGNEYKLVNPTHSSKSRLYVDEVVKQSRTGDVVLFHDKNAGARFIHVFTVRRER